MQQQQEFEVFFDGDCPLCRREIDFLRRRDKAGAICFTDIADTTFDAGTYANYTARVQSRSGLPKRAGEGIAQPVES